MDTRHRDPVSESSPAAAQFGACLLPLVTGALVAVVVAVAIPVAGGGA
jgi:hypothetical protein